MKSRMSQWVSPHYAPSWPYMMETTKKSEELNYVRIMNHGFSLILNNFVMVDKFH